MAIKVNTNLKEDDILTVFRSQDYFLAENEESDDLCQYARTKIKARHE